MIRTLEREGPWCPIGYSSARKAEMRLKLLSSLKAGNYAVSLDQSGFDYHQRKTWVATALEGIMQSVIDGRAKLGLDVSELCELRDSELRSFENAFIPGVCKWKQGVPSGHKWTGLIDSILNRAVAEVVCAEAGLSTLYAFYQGDDAVLVTEGSPGVDWSAEYGKFGLEVNRAKTWISNSACDFLHEIYRGNDCLGFPARIARSIIWKKPSQGTLVQSVESKVSELGSTCLKGQRRGLSTVRLFSNVLTKLSGKSERLKALECMFTPLWRGGFGFGSSGDRTFEWSGGEVKMYRYKLVSFVTKELRSHKAELLKRLSEQTFLRTRASKISFPRLPRDKHIPGTPAFFHHSGRIRCSHNVYSGVPWATSLSWERCLRNPEFAKKIQPSSVIPDPTLRGWGIELAVEAVLLYQRTVKRFRHNLESGLTTGESYIVRTDMANRLWVGFVTHYVLSIIKRNPIIVEKALEGCLAMLACAVANPSLSVRV
jgi:hypothetical protein